MPYGKYQIRIEGADQMVRKLNGMTQAIPTAMSGELRVAAENTADAMKGNTRVRLGELRGSIDYNLATAGRELVAVIGPNDRKLGGSGAGIAIESGRDSGNSAPPAVALQARYGLSLAQAIKAAKTIAQRGTVGQFFIQKTKSQVRGILEAAGVAVLRAVVRR